jgi:hypothetical protein
MYSYAPQQQQQQQRQWEQQKDIQGQEHDFSEGAAAI